MKTKMQLNGTRILTLMGSGETSPTMVKTHREVLAKFAGAKTNSVMLGTPFRFQENAEELGERSTNYFKVSLQVEMKILDLPIRYDQLNSSAFFEQEMISSLVKSDFIFSGPGSPTYALKNWKNTAIPKIIEEKLKSYGAVTFASAAALTLGAYTIPIYEIYKVGEDLRWEKGLGITSLAGLNCAVIPHYDNAEGGTHDTRYCYMGESRLKKLEEMLEKDIFILGIDEHSALVIDIESEMAFVNGLGGVTLRHNGQSYRLEKDSSINLDQLVETALNLGHGQKVDTKKHKAEDINSSDLQRTEGNHEELKIQERVKRALENIDVEILTSSILDLEEKICSTPRSDEYELMRALLRATIVELGALADSDNYDKSEVVASYVEIIIEARDRARKDKRWEEADIIRDQLGEIGIELQDSHETSSWTFKTL
ncbi:MAG: hypothetical protein HKL80_03525 [Acidimicrobiales bacterium]|nr:hypothetical protein [Acidimicrobiales bacterium]